MAPGPYSTLCTTNTEKTSRGSGYNTTSGKKAIHSHPGRPWRLVINSWRNRQSLAGPGEHWRSRDKGWGDMVK